ncbi:hypothetical protein LguiB_004677 [Lonicera macranthoides]
MEFCSRYGVVTAILIVISIVKQSDGRELRPSEHGLTNQDTPPATGENTADMMSFFGGPAASKVPLPEARNMSDMSSWPNSDGGGGRRRDGGREGDHVSEVLLVASVACGATGVVLLIVAAFIFLFRNQKQNGKEKSSTPLALPPPPPPVLALEDKMTTINNTDAS